ncbi:helix-turn-helix transcriptional regulator [Sinorhizobium mexicanum]|uniref:Helix-turn-helix transcriptional regulator n=1 Tax=Sinorhizobium mexicanum TaxID=375549 RepID=A0A859QFB1_9HYPH|nr:helix-turn-helix transcriptional regulator [Sinorhizobium mexicanum]
MPAMSSDLAEIVQMIRRLESAGMTRRQIAEGANVAPSSITRIATGIATAPSYRLVAAIKRFHRKNFPGGEPETLTRFEPEKPTRFAPGCQPRASR